jgi:hypothetical protein
MDIENREMLMRSEYGGTLMCRGGDIRLGRNRCWSYKTIII